MKKLIIACGTLKDELGFLLKKDAHRGDLIYLDPELHLVPKRLDQALQSALEANSAGYDEIAVIYGKCSNDIDAICSEYGAARSPGEHCYEMFAGEKYLSYLQRHPGTYFLTDYLCANFQKLVVKGLGLDRYPELKSAMFGNYRQLVYLDTMGRRMDEEAKKVADYLEVEFFVERCGLGNMEKSVLAALNGKGTSHGLCKGLDK